MSTLLIASTISKQQAKRLLFFFDQRTNQKAWAGRTEGRHKLVEPKSFTNEEGENKLAYTERHAFGRSIRTAPTTNGVTYQLEWSNACSLIDNNAPVSINVFRLKENHLMIRVAPHKSLKTSTRGYNREECAEGCTYEKFHIDLRPKCVRIEFGARNFVILRRHITMAAWTIWQTDTWKFDQIVEEVAGQLICTQDNRERFTPPPTRDLLQTIIDLDE